MLTDLLGRPIQKNDRILVKGYGSTYYQQGIVDTVAKTNVYVYLNATAWTKNPTTGHWVCTKGQKRMARRPDEVIVVNEQLDYNLDTFPELYI